MSKHYHYSGTVYDLEEEDDYDSLKQSEIPSMICELDSHPPSRENSEDIQYLFSLLELDSFINKYEKNIKNIYDEVVYPFIDIEAPCKIFDTRQTFLYPNFLEFSYKSTTTGLLIRFLQTLMCKYKIE